MVLEDFINVKAKQKNKMKGSVDGLAKDIYILFFCYLFNFSGWEKVGEIFDF
jgi:hypothetical protein